MRRRAQYPRVAIGAAAIVLLAAPARAQLPANESWVEHESQHFRTTYPPRLEELARHVTAAAERAHAALSLLVAAAPDGRIDIVVTDNIDLSNGYATPFPSNRIVLYARPPTDALELQYTRDWMELVVTHELAHIFHLDAAGSVGRALRKVFGRVPMPWPLFPSVSSPAWSIEGLAVGVESAVTSFGRVHGSYHEMVVRTAALADRLDEYDRLGSTSSRWPGGARVYIYGSLFMDYLARRYGADAASRIVAAAAGAVIPPPLWFDRVGRNALGVTFRDAYRDWQQEVTARARDAAAAVREAGVSDGEPLTTHSAIALYPRFSPDGTRIAYAAFDWRAPPAVRVIDARNGAQLSSERVHLPSSVSWRDDGTLLTSDIEFTSRFHILSDLYTMGADDRRLTRGARLQEPDAHGDRIVAVQNDGGTNRLVLYDARTGALLPITAYDPDVHWSLPRFSPDGTRIAVARWSRGGRFDIVVLGTNGADMRVAAGGPGVNGAPAWSPDGRWLLFWSDRSGIPNILAVDDAGTLRQVTNVVTGAYFPDVSPDGRWLVYAAYQHDGFRIERMPFDPASWHSPARAREEHALTERSDYAHDPAPLLDTVASAFESADTTGGEQRRYRALRSLRPYYWFPLIGPDDTGEWYFGVWSSGRDLVGRHTWDAEGAAATSGRTRGRIEYRFNGLPELPALRMHPSLGAAVSREWDEYLPRVQPGRPYADEREDVAALSASLVRQRWQSVSGLSFTGELVRRSRKLFDAPGLAFLDPDDDLYGLRGAAFYSRFVTPPRAISRESGVTLQINARQRKDRNVRTVELDDGSTAVFDGSYRELTTWNAAYITLPLPGFARHVLAARASGLLRDGPGAGFSSIGGASSSTTTVGGAGISLGGGALLLPVRGFPRGERFGPRAWTASLEYRIPIALIDTPMRPFFFDRLSASVFADAGHAWCDAATAARVEPEFCPSTSPTSAPLVSAGAEATLLFSVLGFSLPLRAGAAVPIRGGRSREPRAYIATGASF